MEEKMVEPLSQQLSHLSNCAKMAEDAVTAAQREARDKIMQRREEVRAAAKSAAEKVDQKMKSAQNTAASNWAALKGKVAADLDDLKTKVAEKKQQLDARNAESRADRLEWEAGVTIDFAIASIEQAELAVIDAIVGRGEANEARASR
jgi:hypothetical protein